eukprot:5640990-Amphidinium_carterae.1
MCSNTSVRDEGKGALANAAAQPRHSSLEALLRATNMGSPTNCVADASHLLHHQSELLTSSSTSIEDVEPRL